LKEHPNIIHSGPTENSKDEIVAYKCLHWAVNPLDLKKIHIRKYELKTDIHASSC